MNHARRWLAAAVTTALTCTVVSLASVSTTPAGASPSAAPAPSFAYTAQLGVPGASALAVADSHLFISLDNDIYVRDLAGHAIKTIATSASGLSNLLAAPDGKTVFASSDSGNLVAIDTTSLSPKAGWAASGCGKGMAITAGRLFFDSCPSPGQYSISSVDVASGGTAVSAGISTTFYQAPVLAAANGHLVADAGTLYSYTVSGTALTEVAHSSFGVADHLAVSPDGSQVAATEMAPYQVVQFDTATMTEDATFASGAYPTSVAYNGAGDRLAIGLNPSGNSSVQLYDTATATELSAIGPADTLGYTRMGLPGTVNFGPDLTGKADAVVYALAEDYSAGIFLHAMSVTPLSTPHLSLGLSSPKAYGQPLSVAVTFPGHPNTALTLKMLPNSGSPVYTPVRTNQWGIATAAVKVNFTGRIYAYYGGDLLARHEAPNASAIASFVVPTRTTASMLGGYKISGGVLYFRTAASVHLHVVIGPPHARNATVVLQYFSGGKWVSHAPATFATNGWGITDLYLNGGASKYLYRTLVSTPTTVFNTGSSTVAATFKIG